MDRRSSTVKPEPVTVSPVKSNTRRNSLAAPNSSTSSSRWNYLRASTGSCHDHCKYGKEQSFDFKSRDPLQKRIVSRLPDNQILMRSAIFPERTKKSPTLRPKSSSGSGSLNFDGSSGIRKEIGSKPDRRKSLLTGSMDQKQRKPFKEDTPLTKQLSKKVLTQLKERRLSGSPNLPVKSISGPPRLLSSSANSSSLNPKRDNGKAREGKGIGGASVNVQKNVSGGKRAEAKNVLPRLSVGKQKPLNPLPPPNKLDAKSKANVLDETLCVRDVETEPSDRNEKGSERCVSPETPVSLALSFQEEDQMENENGLSVMAMSSSQMKCSVLSSEGEYEVEISESEGSYSDSDYEENPSTEGDRQTWAARNRAALPDNVEAHPMKLRFRRGKIVNLQSDTDTAPRRLKFRRGRTLGESRDINAVSTRKKSMNRREEAEGGNSPDPSEKVVLRHNGVQEKKDGQALLLNNVIEETASKLVETRKSKVKALVGAFETVISLHDTKLPS